MNTNLGPILNKTNVINFMTKIGLRLEMLVNTTSDNRGFTIYFRKSSQPGRNPSLQVQLNAQQD